MASWKKSHSKATRKSRKIAEEEISKPSHEEMEEGYIIQDARHGGYEVYHNGKQVIKVRAGEFDSAVGQIRFHMVEHKFYPDIYYVNERGNIELLDKNGKMIKGWV